jgi:tetratricopeptide (TPR) repeat protein
MSSVTHKTDPAKAISELKEALVIAKKLGQRSLIEQIYGYLGENYKELGNYKDAVAIMEEQRDMEDSTFSIEKAKEIANLESVYELEQSNSKIRR